VVSVGCLLVAGACTDSSPTPVAPVGTAVTAPAVVPAIVPAPAAHVPPAVVDPGPAPVSAAPAGLVTPLPVATAFLPLVDESRPTVSFGELVSDSRALTTWLWFPATPAGRPWPLVVFAHGYAVGPAPYAAMCEAWAAAGYVVAAPEFPLTDAEVAGDYLDESDIDNQPDDVRFVVDSLLAPGSPLAGQIDAGRIAVAGHSDGGVTVLAVATEPLPGLRAVIALSASPVYGGSVASPPLLVIQGDEDDISGYESGAAVYDQGTAPRYLLTLLGGTHLPPFLDGSAYLDTVNKVAVDFLDHYVAGRTPTTAALLAGGDADLTTLDADP